MLFALSHQLPQIHSNSELKLMPTGHLGGGGVGGESAAKM